MSDTHTRTLIKSLSWRIIASLTTIVIAYLFTGKWLLSLGIGGVEVVVKMMLYYFHERGWNSVTWGVKCNSSLDTAKK